MNDILSFTKGFFLIISEITFDHLFGHRSDFFNNLAIVLGLNGQKTIKIDAWAEAQTV